VYIFTFLPIGRICIQTQALLNGTTEQNIQLTVNAWASCMNNLTEIIHIAIASPEVLAII